MKTKQIVFIILLGIGGFTLLFAGIRFFNLTEQIFTSAQHDREGVHIHDETEVHDEHDEADHDDEHVQAEVETHDDHDLPDHDQADHDEEHAGAEDHSDDDLVRLTKSEMKNFGITIERAEPGTLKMELSFPGEIRLNADRQANIVPRLTGIVREIRKSVGDSVRKGEIMTVIESRDLADARAFFHAALERIQLAESNYFREERLWKKKISAEQEYLNAKQAHSEAQIALESAKQKLLALGFSRKYLEDIPHDHGELLTEYNVTAPFDAKVIEKNITLGELLQEDTVAFVVADLSTVWVDLTIYQKDLPFVREGQSIIIFPGQGIADAHGTISYLSPIVSEETRTALARVILPNPEGNLRPGLFVTASLVGEEIPVPLLVSKEALQNLEGEMCVFVKYPEGFKHRAVTIGQANNTHAEIISGLKVGESYVLKGAFELKSNIVTSTMDSHAGHGH